MAIPPILALPDGHASRRTPQRADYRAAVTGYLRYPHLHGELLTFVTEDDVWLAPLDGGRAWRRTADQAPVSGPRFNADGTLIAWSSCRDGAPEVHVAGVDGGQATRLTHWGEWSTAVRGWVGDDVLAVTKAGGFQVDRTRAHAVPVDGSPPRRLPYGPAHTVSFEGRSVLLGSALTREYSKWKRYRGGTTGQVWLDSDGTGDFTRILESLGGNVVEPVFVAGRIAFLADHEGIGNVYSVLPDGTDLRRHSDHEEFYARQLATDGTRLVYQCAGELWLVTDLTASAVPQRLRPRVGGARAGRAPRYHRGDDHLGEYHPDHTGRASAVELLGTVHWLTHRDGPTRTLYARPGARARLPVVLGESGMAAWVTDEHGDDALLVSPVDNSAPARALAGGRLGRVLELAASPDGAWLAAAAHDGRVLLVGVVSGEVRTVSDGPHGDASGLAFSPDSAWLAWSHAGPASLRQIRLAAVTATDEPVIEVTELRFIDTSPVFTADGQHLAFLSLRTFDPVYGSHSFELSFPTGCRPYLVPLSATATVPFLPEPDGRPADHPTPDDPDPRTPEGQHASVTPSEATPERQHASVTRSADVAVVDVEGLTQRLVGLPVPEGNYAHLRAARDGLLWLRAPVSGALGDGRQGAPGRTPRPALERYDLRRRRLEVLADGIDEFAVSGDGRRLVLRDGDQLRVQPADSRQSSSGSDDNDGDDEFGIDLHRLRVRVDPPDQWRQMFDEAARLMRDHFWTADLADVDWDGVQDQYRPLLDRVASADELVDVLWETAGELGTSHAVVIPHSQGAVPGFSPSGRQGQLGADLERGPGGVWRVARVLPGESSDPQARSPLHAPGVAVTAGDELLAVNGVPVDPVRGPSVLLAGTADDPVELTVRTPGAEPRRVVVVPLASEDRLRYHDWVLGRRAHVRGRTGGRLGYLHLPDMLAFGWAQLHRDLRVEVARDALIVDVRGNRGGHISQLVIEKLGRRVLGWELGRHAGTGTYPVDAPRGPVVAVADEFSGSDGDIVTAAIKALGIGPVVGTRTWGGVIGIDLRYTLVDGTLVTQPRYATWLHGHGWDIENHGVEPDIEVVARPQDWAAGTDPQLDAAIDTALAALATTPAATAPTLATRPTRRRPTLPPRT
jgi:tricorn protease